MKELPESFWVHKAWTTPFVDSFMLQPRNDTELLTANWSDQVIGLHLSAKGLGCMEGYLGSSTIAAQDHVRRDGGNSLPGNVFQPHPPFFHTPVRV